MSVLPTAEEARIKAVERRAEKAEATVQQLVIAVRALQQQLNQLRGNQ